MVLTGIDLILSAEAHMMLWFAFLIKLVVITYQCASCLLWCNHNILLYALCMHCYMHYVCTILLSALCTEKYW